MATLTIRLPDDKHSRLKALAQRKKMSINKLIEEISTQTIAEFDSETRFRALATSGNAQRGLELLDKPDAANAKHRAKRSHDA
jgi:plasmid stability protein